MKIYADSLFLLNFTIDYLLLLATGKICALRLHRCRMLAGAVWGGLYSVLAVVLPEFFAMGTVKIFSGTAAVLMAFGGQGRLLRSIVVFFAVSAAFGGAVYALIGLGSETAGGQFFIPVSTRVLVLSFAFCYAALSLVFHRIGKRVERALVQVQVEYKDKIINFTALEDTGNELADPVSGEKVLIMEKTLAEELLDSKIPKETTDVVLKLSDLGLRVRLLSFSTIAGSGGLLVCFKADSVNINGAERGRLVGITQQRLSPDGNYKGIV